MSQTTEKLFAYSNVDEELFTKNVLTKVEHGYQELPCGFTNDGVGLEHNEAELKERALMIIDGLSDDADVTTKQIATLVFTESLRRKRWKKMHRAMREHLPWEAAHP